MEAHNCHPRAYAALSSRKPAREREEDAEEGQSSRQPYRCGMHMQPIRPSSWWGRPAQRAKSTLCTRTWRNATHGGQQIVSSRSFESRRGKGQRKGRHESTAHRSTASQLWWTFLFALNLCMWGLPGALAVDILFPDGVDMANVGVINVPQGPFVLLSFSGSHRGGEELLAGDAISIIRGDRSCKQRAHLDGTPAGVSNVILDAQKRAFFDFSELPPQTGYILCVCPASVMIEESGARICPDDVGFEEETTVDVQDLMTGINFKGTVAGTMTIPLQKISCDGSCPRTHTLTDVQYESTRTDLKHVSIVATDQKCDDTSNHGLMSAVSSGNLQVTPPPNRLIQNFQVLNHMQAGTYKICMTDVSDINNAVWRDSGVVLILQKQVSSISINGIVEIVATIPQRIGSTITLCKNHNCSEEFAPPASAPRMVSFIPRDYSCRETQVQNPPVRPTGSGIRFSGHIQVDTDGSLLPSAVDGLLDGSGSGILQMCLKEDDAIGFVATGIMLEIQDDILGLSINELEPRKWWRVSAPRSQNTFLRYLSNKAGMPGDSIALIRTTNLCSVLCRTKTKPLCLDTEVETSASQFWSANGRDKVLGSECLKEQDDFRFGCLERPDSRTVDMTVPQVGIYKVCFRKRASCANSDCWPEWQSTGMQVNIQSFVTSVEINGAGGATVNPGQGQRAVIPRARFHTLLFTGINSVGARLKMLRGSEECSDFSTSSAVMPLAQNQIAQANPDVRLSGSGVDRLLDLSVGIYQICVLPQGNITFSGTGVSIRIQNYTDGLEVNGVRPNRGLRIAVPKYRSSRLRFFRQESEMEIGDRISIIQLEDDCFNPEHNPALQTAHTYTNSGHMTVIGLPLIGNEGYKLLSGSDAVWSMPAKMYKVCFKAASSASPTVWWDTTFLETGLTVTIQNALEFAMINIRDPEAVLDAWSIATSSTRNRGVRLTAPRADNILFSVPGPGKYSFIGFDKDCSSAGEGSENPAMYMNEVMHLTAVPLEGSSFFHLPKIGLNSVIGRFGVRFPGLYQVCISLSGSPFIPTGISLHLQGEVTQMIVNGVRPNFGLRVALPQSSKNIIRFEGDLTQAGSVEKLYSFIQVGGDCSLITDNAVNQSSAASGHMRSGFVDASDLKLPSAQTDRMQDQALGLYQVCFGRGHSGGVVFTHTGLSVVVQDRVLRLQVNNVPKIQSVIPKSANNEVSFCKYEDCSDVAPGVLTPSDGVHLSFILSDQECEDVVNGNTQSALAGRSGHIDNENGRLRMAKDAWYASLDGSLGPGGTLFPDIYQVCVGTVNVTSGSVFSSTGLSLLVQEYLTGLVINGVTPGFGLNVAIPKSQTSPAMSYASPQFGNRADRVSLILATLDCNDPMNNPALPIPTSSGHLASTGSSKELQGTANVKSLAPAIYQVCFQGIDGVFRTTGLSASIQERASGFSTGAAQPPLSVVVEKELGATFCFFGQKTESWSPWPPVKASLILPSRSCTSASMNPPQSAADTSGHLGISKPENAFVVNLPADFDTDEVLTELLYQLCVKIGQEWYSTGLSVQVQWKTTSVRAIDFDLMYSQESSALAGSSNAVHMLMKTTEIIPPAGILRIEGLLGSQTVDSPYFEVEGNSVEERKLTLVCAGNFSCQATTPQNYIETGKILMLAEMTIEVACTDFDSECTTCAGSKADCSEGIASAVISNEVRRRDITSKISRGPWKDCIKKCSDSKSIISNHDILDLATKSGSPLRVALQTTDATSFYTCDSTSTQVVNNVTTDVVNHVTLSAKIIIRMLVSTLSSHLLNASFSSSSGRLTVPHVPFDKNKYIHVTFILVNSFFSLTPRIPSASIVSAKGDGVAVRSRVATIVPKTTSGILMAEQGAQFTSTSIEMSSKYTSEMNRITVRLKTNWPASIPAVVLITITGLVGSNQPDDDKLALLDSKNLQTRTFECVGTSNAKQCIVDVDAGLPATIDGQFHRATLDIDILCSDFGSYPTKYIKAISACSQLSGQTQCPAFLSDKLVFDEEAYSRGPWQECLGCSTSMRSVMKGYDLSQPGGIMDRFDTFGLKRFSLEMFASQDVSDSNKCYGSTTPLVLKAILTVRIEYSRSSARWVKSTGSLTANVSPVISTCSSSSPLSCLPEVEFSFELRNPSSANAGPVAAQVSARGGGLDFALASLPPVLHIIGPRDRIEVTAASIRESTRIQGDTIRGNGLNTLSVSIDLDRLLPVGTIITLSGLLGSQTSSEACDTVVSPKCGGAECIFSPADAICQKGIQLRGHLMGSSVAASWDKTSGTLRFVVMQSFALIKHLEFRFDLYNAASGQAAKSVTVSGSGAGFLIVAKEMTGTVLSSDLMSLTVNPDPPSILSAIVGENNKVEFEANRLQFSMQMNVPMDAGTRIEIGDLAFTFLYESTGLGWNTDVLPNTAKISTSTEGDDAQRIQQLAQFVSEPEYHMPWLCSPNGWGVELEQFHEDHEPFDVCEKRREGDADDILPSDCAAFYEKQFCIVQPKHSVSVFLKECVHANQPVSFAVKINNGPLPTASVNVPPSLMIDGGSITATRAFQMSTLNPTLSKICKGWLSCSTSFVQDERFLDSGRRFVPPYASLTKATISIDLACSSFSDPGQFLQRISLCIVPDCKKLYGGSYEWDQENNACCNDFGCQTYVCADKLPVPRGQLIAFDSGPWKNCQGDCSRYEVVLDLYDVMPIICQGQATCSKPKSFTIFMSATGAADKFACSGTSSSSTFVVSTVELKLELSYSSAAFASEPVRLDQVSVTQTTNAKQALSKFTVKIDSMVTFPANSEVVITGLKGSMTTDSETITIAHQSCGIGAMVDESIRIPCSVAPDCEFKSWNQAQGELHVRLLRQIASVGDNLQFAFVLRNAIEKQESPPPLKFTVDGLIVDVTVRLGGPAGAVVGPKSTSKGVLSSGENSEIIEGALMESVQVRDRINRLTVSFRTNFHLFKESNVTINGLLNSQTESALDIPVEFEGYNITGHFNQKDGILRVQLPKFYDPDEQIIFSFSIANARNEQSNLLLLEVPSASPAWDELVSYVLISDGFKATENLGFIEALLKQQSSIADQMNRLECAFTPANDFPVGSIIVLSGLLGSQTPSTLELPTTIQDASGLIQNILADWNQQSGVLSFAQQSPLLAGSPYRFFFHLLNARQQQPKRLVRLSVHSGSAQIAMRQVGSVLDASEEAEFIDARISESSRRPSSANFITLVLQLNIDLVPSVHEIILTGILSAADSSLSVDGPSALDFDISIRAQDQALVFEPKSPLPSNESYHFHWTLNNPSAPTTSRDCSVLLFNKMSAVADVPPKRVAGSIFSSMIDGEVSELVIHESSQTQSAINRVRVELRLNFPLSYRAMIKLSGLTDAPVLSTSLEVLGERSDLFRSPGDPRSLGTWTQSTGTLELRILKPTIVNAGENIVFEFDLINPLQESANKVSSVSIPDLVAVAKNFDNMVLLAPSVTSIAEAAISESTAVPSVLNTLTVSFSVNSELAGNGATKVTVKGLIEQDTPPSVANAIFSSYSNEKLVVSLMQAVAAFDTISFSFQLLNPGKAQSAKTPVILASTLDSSGRTVLFNESSMRGSILSAAEPRQFVFTEIEESTAIQGSLNHLSLTLRANALMSPGEQIKITNLRGSQTVSTSCLSVSSLQSRIRSCGHWYNNVRDGVGELVITIDSIVQAFEDISFSFSLINPSSRQDGVVPIASSNAGFRPTAVVPGRVEWHDGVKKWRGDQLPSTVLGTVLTASDTHFWTSGSVEESSAIAGEDNSLLLSMSANSLIPASNSDGVTTVTVTGLVDTSEADTGAFPIQGQNGIQADPGTWTRITGVLTFRLTSEIQYGDQLAFIITLKNPAAAQAAVRPLVSLSRESNNGNWKIAPLETQPESGKVCCLSADDSPSFLLATVRESSSVKDALNVLHFAFRTNIRMTTDTRITIRGLLGSQTPDNKYLVLMNSTSISGKWRQDGVLEFNVYPSMYHCDCIPLCVQNSLAVSVQLRNPASAKPKPVLTVSAQRGGMKVEETGISGSVLRADKDPGLFAAVSESSKVSGEANNITIRMIADSDLDICRGRWLIQDTGVIAAQQTVSMTEIGGNAPDPVTELGKLFDGLVDTAVSIQQDHTSGQLQDIFFDFGEVFRLEALSVTTSMLRSSLNEMKFQCADSLDAADSEWQTAAEMTLGISLLPRTSVRFDKYSRFWRIRMKNNYDKGVFPKSTTLSEIKFYGCPDSETAALTVSNLTAASGRVDMYNVQAGMGRLRPYGTQTDDLVSIKVSKTVRAFTEVMFTFTTTNAPRAQIPRLAGVSVSANLYDIPRTFAFGQMLSSDEKAQFVLKTISENNDLQSDFNTLSISLRANVKMEAGDHIRIIFQEAYMENNLDPDLFEPLCVLCTTPAVPVSAISWHPFTNVLSLGYADMRPSMIMTLQEDVPKFSTIQVEYLVKNPKQAQASGLTPKVVASGIAENDMQGNVLQANRAGPSFAKRTISQTSRMASAKNQITVSLMPGPGVDLEQGTTVSICGLQGTHKDAETALAFPQVQTFLSRSLTISNTYTVKNCRFVGECGLYHHVAPALYPGEIRACLEFTLTGPWLSGSVAVASFIFKNPAIELTQAPIISVVADAKITIALDFCKEMDEQDTSRCNINSDVLMTTGKAGFLALSMGQDNPAVKQRSTFSVTLTPNVLITARTTLTLSGLVGLDPAYNAALDIKGSISHLVIRDSWSPATGVLILSATGYWNSASAPDVLFRFTVINPDATQPDSEITVCSEFNVPDDGFDDLSGGAMAVGGSNCSEPLVLGAMQVNEEVTFVIRDISESSNVENQDNIIEIELSSNFEMLPGTILTVTGLTGSQTVGGVWQCDSQGSCQCDPQGSCLELASSYSDDGTIQTTKAIEWRQATGMLKMSLERIVNIWPAALVFSFVLRNPTRADAQTSEAKAYLTVQNVGASKFVLLELDGSILRATDVARFTFFSIVEQTRVTNQRNTIVINLKSNVGISKGGTLTLSGLIGRDNHQVKSSQSIECVANPETDQNTTYSLPSLDVYFMNPSGIWITTPRTSTENSVIVNSKSCLQVDSTIKVDVPIFVAPGSNLALKFRVVNWESGLAGCAPSISFSGCRARIDVHGNLNCTGTESTNDCSGCDSSDFTTVKKVASKTMILQSGIAPMIWKKTVVEDTDVLSQPNEIKVTLAMNIELTTGSTITLTGFQNSQSPTQMLIVTDDDSSMFAATGPWSKEDGTLVLTAGRYISINETLVFAFKITNKGVQDKARCRYGTNFCSGVDAYNEGRACPRVGSVCSGFCAGGKPYCSSLTIRGSCSTFSSADLKIPSKLQEANALCEGGACFPPNNGFQCPPDALVNSTSRLKVDGMLTDPTVEEIKMIYFGKLAVLKGQECNGDGISCKAQSICTAPNEGEECTKHIHCTGPFDPSIQNTPQNFVRRAALQRCTRTPRISVIAVKVMAERANISSTRVSGKINGFASPGPPEFKPRTISEISAVTGAKNVITVNLVANFGLYAVSETTITLTGLPLHKYGIDSRVPLLPPSLVTQENLVSCTWSGSTVACDNLGFGIKTDDDNIVLTASIDIKVECAMRQPSACSGPKNTQGEQMCLLVNGIVGDRNWTLPIGSYRAAPCIEDPSFRCVPSANGRFECPIAKNLDVMQMLADSEGQGFQIKLKTNVPVSTFFNVRAVLKYNQTAEYAWYNKSFERLIVSGDTAPSIKRGDRDITFSFPLKNAETPQKAPAVTILGESGLVKRIGLCDDEIEDGCQKGGGLPNAILSRVSGSVLTSAAEGPMRYASIRESSNTQGIANILTVELEVETVEGEFLHVLSGSAIIISGLTGSPTSTRDLLVSGHGISSSGDWDQAKGKLIVRVNSMPKSELPSSVIFSFELQNPNTSQEPRKPSVLIEGTAASYGGPSLGLVCATRMGCSGVMAAGESAQFTSVQVRETTRYIEQRNTLSFFLAANVPLLTDGLQVSITGLADIAAAHPVLTQNPGTSRRAATCVGVNRCVLRHNQSPVPGTIVSRMYTDVVVACTDEIITSRTFQQDIGNLQIHAVKICDHSSTNQAFTSTCSASVKKWAVLEALEVKTCSGSDDMLIRIEGRGLMQMTSTLNVDYLFDVSSNLILSGQALALTVVGNLSDHAPATRDLYTMAFSFNYTNSATRQTGFQPTVSAVMPDGIVIQSMQAATPSSGVGGSGVEYCSGVQVIVDKTALPDRNTGLLGGQTLRVYQEIKDDGVAECIFVIQPENPNKFLLQLTFDEYDVSEETEQVEMFNGDSPSSPRMGILYKKMYEFGTDPKYFEASQDIFVEECAVTFRLQARRRVSAGQQKLLGYTEGLMGFALTYKLVDPNKMNHFKAQLGFSGMVDSITDESLQLKLRKVFGATMMIMYPSVVFDSASVGRRSLVHGDVHANRRSGTAAAAIRVLCTSPDGTLQKAEAFGSQLSAGLVTAAMNDAGIPGGVVLTAPIEVFRCGFELECVPRELVVIPEPPPPPVPPEVTPAPFPIEAVLQISIGLIIGPLIVAMCVCACYVRMKKKDGVERAAKKEQGIEAYNHWIEEKTTTLQKMSVNDLGKMAEKFEFVEEDQWDPAEIHEMIPEMAKFFFRTERGCGLMPEGVYRHVPPKLYASGEPSAPAKTKSATAKPSQVPQVEAELCAEVQFDDKNGEDKIIKKRAKKAAPQHNVKWVKRAAYQEKTHEEVAV